MADACTIPDADAAQYDDMLANPDIVADDDLIVIVVISVSSIAIPSRLLNFEILKRIRRDFTMRMIHPDLERHLVRNRGVPPDLT